jgi:hypothetical protein
MLGTHSEVEWVRRHEHQPSSTPATCDERVGAEAAKKRRVSKGRKLGDFSRRRDGNAKVNDMSRGGRDNADEC